MIEPLVPADIDLRGLPWMRLDTARLLDSDLFALSSGPEFKAAVALWCKSWTQRPAGSLPTDDKVLAHLSGAGSSWKRVKAMALRGWCVAQDGRMYHEVVAEQVLAAWEERVAFREKQTGQRERKQRERDERAAMFEELKGNGIHLPFNAPTGELRQRVAQLGATDPQLSPTSHSDGHGLDGTGRDGTGIKLSDTSQRAESLSSLAEEMARALRVNGFPDCSGQHPDLVELARAGHTQPEVLEAAIAGAGAKSMAWIAARVRNRRRDAQAPTAPGDLPRGASAVVVDATAARRERDARALDDNIRKHRNDFELGITDATQRDERIAADNAKFAAEWGSGDAGSQVA